MTYAEYLCCLKSRTDYRGTEPKCVLEILVRAVPTSIVGEGGVYFGESAETAKFAAEDMAGAIAWLAARGCQNAETLVAECMVQPTDEAIA